MLAIVGHGAGHGPMFVDGLRAALLVSCGAELAGALVALLRVRTPARDRALAAPRVAQRT